MLTLQDILGSDSFATAIQKINENFKSIAIGGGGPQGIRGEQGIPGLPGKQGATGPIGPAGNNGISVDILPFDQGLAGYTGPLAGPAVGQVNWSIDSLNWLQDNYGDTGALKVPTPGMVVIDHANFGYWQYLDGIQNPSPVDLSNPLDPGAQDSDALVTQGYYIGASWTGPGWYYYPSDLTNIITSLGDVWVNDYTTYLTGPTSGYDFPAPGSIYNAPYTVPKARLKSKFGVIWISSHNSQHALPAFASPANVDESPYIKDVFFGNEGERSAGVDRLLFKLSLDGRTITENVMSQAYTGPTDGTDGNDINNGPYGSPNVLTPWEDSYIRPIYGKSLYNYSPLVFLSPWSTDKDDLSNLPVGINQGNLGIFAYQAPITEDEDQTPVQLWILSHRKENAPDNNLIPAGGVYPTSRNLGEHLIDSRRTITSNQYAALPSQDTAPIDEIVRVFTDTNTAILESEDGPFVYQGFHALMNGSFVNNDYFVKKYFTDSNPTPFEESGPWVEDADTWYNNQISLAESGIDLYKRASWFGSSVHVGKPSETDGEINEYIRSSGMMERDRSIAYIPGDEFTKYVERGDELLFYTAYTEPVRINLDPYAEAGLTSNTLSSRLVFHASPSRNFGITNVPKSDVGVIEPHSRLHVHSRTEILNERLGKIWGDIVITGDIGQKTDLYNLVASFTSEVWNGGRLDKPSSYTVIKIGDIISPDYQSETDIFTDYLKKPQGGIRFESYGATNDENSSVYNTGSLQLGIGLGTDDPQYEISETDENFQNEWVLSVSPVATGQTSGDSIHSDRNKFIAGVGIQERFAKTRFHMYGQNTYRSIGDGEKNTQETVFAIGYPSVIPDGNTPSHRQISLDYVNNSWQVSAGILDYAYSSYNIINYPFTEGYNPKTIYGSGAQPSYDTWVTFTGPATSNDGNQKLSGVLFPFFGAISYPLGVATSSHGGQYNAMFDTNHYQGFNLIRDLSYDGDDNDVTTWTTGTDGNTNGAAAFLTDKNGNFGITSIPAFRDGGVAAGRYEQRNLGNREVLNSMKFFFDTAGNLGISNKPGFDPNAYPALYKDSLNNVNYLNSTVGTGAYPAITIYTGPSTPRMVGTAGPHNWGGQIPGKLAPYAYPAPLTGAYDRAWIAAATTQSEVIRAEIAAEKLFSAPGRIMQNRGWGYDINRTIAATYLSLSFTLWDSITNLSYSGTLKAATDSEGRITNIFFSIPDANAMQALGGGTWIADRILITHPTEVIAYNAPIGALAPAIDKITFGALKPVPITIDWTELNDGVVHSANVRINNFVAGEGEGVLGTAANINPSGYIKATPEFNDATATKTQSVRRSSPKIILTYEGIDPSRGQNTPIKVNTVIRSAQNESSLREYWIPKADNNGGTFMTFTSHFETPANNDAIDKTSVKKERLQIEEITYVALDYRTGGGKNDGIGAPTGYFHPTYVKYQFSPFTPSAMTPDAIGWSTAIEDAIPYHAYYDAPASQPYFDQDIIHPLRQRTNPTGADPATTIGYKYAVEIDKTNGSDPISLREDPTQIRFRRINSEWAMMDFNITLKVNDQWDLDLDDPNDYSLPDNAKYDPGTFTSAVTRRGMWWLQHVKIRFDIDSGMVQATAVTPEVNVPDYHATKYDNGMGFRMWSDYNQWFSGNAVAHRGVANAIGYPNNSNAYQFDTYQKTFNHNVWNWPLMMSDYLNSNSRVIPTELDNWDIPIITGTALSADLYFNDSTGTVATPIYENDAVAYDRLLYIRFKAADSDTSADVNEAIISYEQADGVYSTPTVISCTKTSTLFLLPEAETNSSTVIIPAGCKYKIKITGLDDTYNTVAELWVTAWEMGSTFPLDYHNNVRNTGIALGISSTSGALLPFVQALRNRLDYNGTWDDLYDEGDGMWGVTYINIDRLMRQVWTTFGNKAFMKSKPLQWRVTPYNDTGVRGGGYETDGTGGNHAGLPKASTYPGGDQNGYENSFYLEAIIPDGILHDPVGGFGSWYGVGTKDTQELIEAGFTDSRDYRYVTISGQAMVNFQENTFGTDYLEEGEEFGGER